MGFGQSFERFLKRYRNLRLRRSFGPLGDYYRAGYNNLLYENLPINSQGIVIDGGGYKGKWTDEILCRYGCKVIVLEPIPEFASKLKKRYQKNNRVEVIEAALGGSNCMKNISFLDDGSSFYRENSETTSQQVLVKDIFSCLQERDITDIECIKLNIEGGEYEVLERMAEVKILKKVRCFLIQFHDINSNSQTRRSVLQKCLAQTHIKRFDFPFVWECWIARDTL